MTNCTPLDNIVDSIESQAYAECCADTIETVRPGVGVMNCLIIACKSDLSRKGENLTHLLALVG